MMQRSILVTSVLLLTACGGEIPDSRHNDYASGPLPTADAVQAQAVIDTRSTEANIVSETIVGRELTADGAVDPAARTEQFAPGEQVHLAVKLETQPDTSDEVRITWYGPDDALLAEDAQHVPRNDRYISFSSGETTNWNPGSYRAEIWLGNQKLAEQRFALATADEVEATPTSGDI